jgi:hypothetical protein
MEQQLFTVASSFFSALVAAFLASFLSLRKFKKERLWQEKYEAYKEILTSIHEMRFWASENYASSLCLPTAGMTEETWQLYSLSKKTLLKHIQSGQLLISDPVTEQLQALVSEIWNQEHSFQDTGTDEHNYHEELAKHAEKVGKIIDTYLAAIVQLSKSDLN